MASMSDYLENKLIDHLFKATAYTAPVGLYVALYTSAPSDSGGGTEVTGGAYARVNLAPSSSANWRPTQGGTTAPSTGTTGTTSNAVAVTFPSPSANWGTVVAFGVFDASTSGNLLIFGNLTISKTVNNGDAAPSFAIDALTFQIDN